MNKSDIIYSLYKNFIKSFTYKDYINDIYVSESYYNNKITFDLSDSKNINNNINQINCIIRNFIIYIYPNIDIYDCLNIKDICSTIQVFESSIDKYCFIEHKYVPSKVKNTYININLDLLYDCLHEQTGSKIKLTILE